MTFNSTRISSDKPTGQLKANVNYARDSQALCQENNTRNSNDADKFGANIAGSFYSTQTVCSGGISDTDWKIQGKKRKKPHRNFKTKTIRTPEPAKQRSAENPIKITKPIMPSIRSGNLFSILDTIGEDEYQTFSPRRQRKDLLEATDDFVLLTATVKPGPEPDYELENFIRSRFSQTMPKSFQNHMRPSFDLDLAISMAPVLADPGIPEYTDSDQWPVTIPTQLEI
ncbi:hypothetical protein METBIDRAFT_229712 [Metschnikowia bicuspidata var. bicuspidata NRRL YB-4993]|uniref:Uncharacterized protein n=1 Tax=Metschnikowia bicuspidata var. bicuspidata NRRL YB-4993 TaxID=869754 RepID=A0A1A0HBD5_9ASCO|nr:hypothetical protein METBIDRAFT_229712 [Metschnikowia bicuspidata var. bicuspidata NRRL YB-4993]OBA21300.1 hypothetical protein METBIDRAFT_229712 [Metschnikowia bicuspidata var. bicuspidata NRRL YB-4993]